MDVYDHDDLGKDDFMGRLRVSMADLADKKLKRMTMPSTARAKTVYVAPAHEHAETLDLTTMALPQPPGAKPRKSTIDEHLPQPAEDSWQSTGRHASWW